MFIQIFIYAKNLGNDSKYPVTYPFPFYGPHRIRLLGYNVVNSNTVAWLGLNSRTMRNPAQVGPYLFVLPTEASIMGHSYGWFECELAGQVDFQVFDAATNIEIENQYTAQTSMVLSFEVEKLSELSSGHHRHN